ncbi:MAG: putative toxin-antitoxin system toxin component, PIN family, partial [Candidatus Njordarchaeota archaeon]
MGARKVVLDTSVFVAGIIGHGASKTILGAIIDCSIVPILCREILEEYIRVIHYPKIVKKVSPSDIYSIIDAIHKKAEIVAYEDKIHICRDSEDDKFIELSAKTSALLITLDND